MTHEERALLMSYYIDIVRKFYPFIDVFIDTGSIRRHRSAFHYNDDGAVVIDSDDQYGTAAGRPGTD